MKIVWICLLIYSNPGGSYGPAVSVVDNLATVEDCHRVGTTWKKVNSWDGMTYRYVQVRKK